jgi:hypothetical protein
MSDRLLRICVFAYRGEEITAYLFLQPNTLILVIASISTSTSTSTAREKNDLLQATPTTLISPPLLRRHPSPSPPGALFVVSPPLLTSRLHSLPYQTQNPSCQSCHNTPLQSLGRVLTPPLFTRNMLLLSRCIIAICHPSSLSAHPRRIGP